jgi:hypothetical protein
MATGRREFLSRLATGAAIAAGAGMADPRRLGAETPPRPASDKFDFTWQERVKGKFRAVFDSPKTADGGEVWRAASWRDQVEESYGTRDDEVTSILVIRHEGIPLVMDDVFWDRHKLGRKHKLKDPWTGKYSPGNPMRSFEGKPNVQPAMLGMSLEGFQKRGGIILACNFAFGMMVGLEAEADRDHAAEARARALEHLLPGIILQPSGFFALLEAQRMGCHLFAGG